MKKLKFLLLALLVSCTFVLAGCGDGQLGAKADANIGNVDAYTEATADEITEFSTLVDAADEAEITSYKITMDVVNEVEPDVFMKVKYNAIIAEVEGDLQMAIKMEMEMPGEGEAGAKMWIKDEVLYMEATAGADEMKDMYGATKIKMPFEIASEMGLLEMLEGLEMFNISSLMGMVKSIDFEEEGLIVKANVEGTTQRFEITMEAGEGVVTKMYVVFEDGALYGFQLATNFDGSDVNVTIAAFDGEIEFPNADDFEDFSIIPE